MKGHSAPDPPSRTSLWERVVRHFADAIIVTDSGARIAIFNPAAEELTGIARTRALNKPCSDIFPETPILGEMIARAVATQQSESRGDQTLRGTERWTPIRATCFPLWGERGAVDGAALVLQDLSYQRALEETVRRNDALARLGTLVAGLAHEVRNPLAGIKGAAQLLARHVRDGAAASECISVITRETDRLTELVDNLLDLGSPHLPEMRPTNIHQVLRRVLSVLATELSETDLQVRCELDPSLPDVNANPKQLHQLFLNLLKNAIDATVERGAETSTETDLVLRTRMETDSYIARDGASGRGNLRVDVMDRGPGIAPDLAARVFEPFFTTKPAGTGLGLAISQRIVSEHRGSIRVSARAGGGAVVSVSLPLLRARDGST